MVLSWVSYSIFAVSSFAGFLIYFRIKKRAVKISDLIMITLCALCPILNVAALLALVLLILDRKYGQQISKVMSMIVIKGGR